MNLNLDRAKLQKATLLKIKQLLVFGVIFSIFAFLAPSPTRAAESFTYSYFNTYTILPEEELIDVSQAVTITSFSEEYQITKGSPWDFTIPVRRDPSKFDEISAIIIPTISVKGSNGKAIEFQTEASGNTIKISTTIQKNILPYLSETITLNYKDPELFEKVGKAKNIYVPGLSEETEFTTTDKTTGLVYNTEFNSRIQIPLSMDDPSMVTITPKANYTKGLFRVFDYTQDQILGKSIWLQFGKSQIYKFEIKQKAIATDATDIEKTLGLKNSEYNLIIPADASQSNQKVYYENFSPKPTTITKTKEGNLIAKYNIKPDFDGYIKVTGYITIDNSKISNEVNRTGTFKEIPSELDYLTESAEYWEVDATEIQDKAMELKSDSDSVIETVEKTYNFVVSNIDYDDKFVYGKTRDRKGALETLRGAESVCMEYSDLFIALSRAQGIPARAAFGKGYDPNVPNSEQVGHQWAEVWVPKIGWITIDTTWGESGRNFIGYDIDHALWFVRENNPNVPAEIEVISRESINGLTAPESVFAPVESMPETATLTSQTQLLDEYRVLSLSDIPSSINLESITSKIPGNNIILIFVPALLLILLVFIIQKALNIVSSKKQKPKTLAEIEKEDLDRSKVKQDLKDIELDNPFNQAPNTEVPPTIKPDEETIKRIEKFNVTGSEKVKKALEDLNKPSTPDTK